MTNSENRVRIEGVGASVEVWPPQGGKVLFDVWDTTNGHYSVVVVQPDDARTLAKGLLDVADTIDKEAKWDGREVERDCI